MNLNDININSQYTCRITGTTDYVDILVLDKNVAVGVIKVKYLTNAAGSSIAANTEEWVSFSTFDDIVEKPIITTGSAVEYTEATQTASSSNAIESIEWGMIGGKIDAQEDLMVYLNTIKDKQDKLESGTNIRKINGQSVLVYDGGQTDINVGDNVKWSTVTGNIDDCEPLKNAFARKQEKLVSGTNIKTINGKSVLVGTGTETTINTDIAVWEHVTGSYTDNTSLNSKLTEIDGKYNNLDETIDSLSSDYDELRQEFVSISAQHGELDSQYNTLKNDYNTQKGQLNSYKGYYESLNNNYTSYVSKYEALKTDINAFETKLATTKQVDPTGGSGHESPTITINTSEARLFTSTVDANTMISLEKLSNTNGASSYLATGTEAQLICYNSGANAISLTLPQDDPYIICNAENAFDVDAGCCGEINFVSDGIHIYVRGI